MTGEDVREDSRLIPVSSQTVGPFFRIGLEYLIDRTPEFEATGRIELRGRVLDQDGAPVPDAVLEFWAPVVTASTTDPVSAGFRRAATDDDGKFAVAVLRPEALALEDKRIQAPHMLVLVFARGLLRHLLTRVYFEQEISDTSDPVLQEIPANRRGTLIARVDNHQTNSYHWNVVLQGPDETVFFAW
jgi:protocatechuate 3,4-dioxygenase alpha subunit